MVVLLLLQEMTLSSNKVRTFGMEGKKEGQFFDPAGLVTDDMGNLIVNDAGNDRLQVSVLMQENVTNSFFHLSNITLNDYRYIIHPLNSLEF